MVRCQAPAAQHHKDIDPVVWLCTNLCKISPGNHWHRPEHHQTSDSRLRPWCADWRGAVDAPACGSAVSESDMLLPPALHKTPTSAWWWWWCYLQDYNAILAVLLATTLAPLQRVLHAAAWLVLYAIATTWPPSSGTARRGSSSSYVYWSIKYWSAVRQGTAATCWHSLLVYLQDPQSGHQAAMTSLCHVQAAISHRYPIDLWNVRWPQVTLKGGTRGAQIYVGSLYTYSCTMTTICPTSTKFSIIIHAGIDVSRQSALLPSQKGPGTPIFWTLT